MSRLLTFFADAPPQCIHGFFGLLPWYQYLNFSPPDPTSTSAVNQLGCSLNLDLTTTTDWNQLWLIGIALLDDLLRVAGFVAVVLVIWGGIRYVTSQGEPENLKAAQGTILNSLIGLVIAIVSVTLVNFMGNELGGNIGGSGLPQIAANANLLTTILNLVFSIIGAISLLMVVIGGFKYITSTGDAQRINSAKNTILYSLVGVVISAFAFAIVNFVLVKLG